MMRAQNMASVCVAPLSRADHSRASQAIDCERVAIAGTQQLCIILGAAPTPAIRAGFFPLTRLNTLLPHPAGAQGGRLRLRTRGARRRSFDR
jgi:hypothetical protein